MSGRVGAIPYGVFAAPIRTSHWVAAAAFTPEILTRQLALRRCPRHRWSHLRPPESADADHGRALISQSCPLRWKNQGGAHIGVESPLGGQWTLRARYAYMSDPVPSSTLLPLTAAIMRDTLTTGAGWSRGHWRWDAAYQIQTRSSESVGKSTILAGEYDNSRVGITLQSVTFTARRTF